MEDDLDRALADDRVRETIYVEGGPLADFLVRVGAYSHHPIDHTTYHDWKGHGFPRDMSRPQIPPDPSMPFSEYAHLFARTSPEARAILLRHPSTPKDVLQHPPVVSIVCMMHVPAHRGDD